MSLRKTLKAFVPYSVVDKTRPMRKAWRQSKRQAQRQLWDSWYKRIYFRRSQNAHEKRLQKLSQKSKIRVLFLVVDESVWKLDAVFRRMQEDPFFEPFIFIYPERRDNDDPLIEERLKASFKAFQAKGYPVIQAQKNIFGQWKGLREYQADLLFFTRPHEITSPAYYDKAYNNYLSCYIAYSHSVSRYGDYFDQYDRYFHSAIWQIFVPHPEVKKIFTLHSHRHGEQVTVTGYPFAEAFFQPPQNNPWKHSQATKIIWAPHHTISDQRLKYAHFLSIANAMKDMAALYQDRVQFAFKPHPSLKVKLYQHPDWGREKTDAYYSHWEHGPNSQLEEGSYSDLFLTSDAMIHDCGSFLAEYQYVQKPVFYVSDQSIHDYLNPLGEEALKSCRRGLSADEIRLFIEDVIHKRAKVDSTFFKKHLSPYFQERLPSEDIVSRIKQAIQTGKNI